MSDRRTSFLRAFAVSALGTGLSRILGAIRDMSVAALLGTSAAADAFWVAFTLPNVFRRFVADEGLTGAVIPAVSRAEAEDGTEAAHLLADRVFGVLILANIALCIAGAIFAEPLVIAFAYAFTEDPDKLALTVSMTRWLFPFVAFVSLVSYFEGLLNLRGHFFIPKVAPGIVSAGVVACAWGFGTSLEEPVWAVVIGVMAGGFVHVLVHLPILGRRWGPLVPRSGWGGPRVGAVLKELSKVVAIGVFAQINILVLRQLAAYLGDGAITRFWYANRLVDLSQGIIAVAIGSALLPHISSSIAAKDDLRLRNDLVGAFRLTAFLLLPAAATLLVFAEPATAMLFRIGRFTMEDVRLTADALRLLVPFMLSVAGINLLKKVYFALDDRNTLLWGGALGVATTAAVGMALAPTWGLVGLSAALSVATFLQLIAYVVVLRRRLGTTLGLDALLVPLSQMALATVPVLLILWFAIDLGAWDRGPASLFNWAVLLGSIGLAAAGYLGTAWALQIEELTRVVSLVRRRMGR